MINQYTIANVSHKSSSNIVVTNRGISTVANRGRIRWEEEEDSCLKSCYTLLPLLPPGFLVVSCGTGVTSSIRPMRKPALANALIAA